MASSVCTYIIVCHLFDLASGVTVASAVYFCLAEDRPVSCLYAVRLVASQARVVNNAHTNDLCPTNQIWKLKSASTFQNLGRFHAATAPLFNFSNIAPCMHATVRTATVCTLQKVGRSCLDPGVPCWCFEVPKSLDALGMAGLRVLGLPSQCLDVQLHGHLHYRQQQDQAVLVENGVSEASPLLK